MRRFADRSDAGAALAAALMADAFSSGVPEDVVILAVPRGGVPVARVVADRLERPLDVIVVRKLGVPGRPELAFGAIGEGAVEIHNQEVIGAAGLTEGQIETVGVRERAELERRLASYRHARERISVRGATVVVVDDGVATGASARAACEVARAAGAAKVILAVPVAPHDVGQRFDDVADEVVVARTPRRFHSVGQFYVDFGQTPDSEVVRLLAGE